MFNPWLALSLKALQMGVEAQSVIALRMLRLATGGARMEAEASRMVTEKVAAATEARPSPRFLRSPAVRHTLQRAKHLGSSKSVSAPISGGSQDIRRSL